MRSLDHAACTRRLTHWKRSDESVCDQPSARDVPVRGVVNTVRDEPGRLSARRPVEHAHHRIFVTCRQKILVTASHSCVAVEAGCARERDRVHPHHWLVADDGHHLSDAGPQSKPRAGCDIGCFVGAQREDPAPTKTGRDLLFGSCGGVLFRSEVSWIDRAPETSMCVVLTPTRNSWAGARSRRLGTNCAEASPSDVESPM